jgi:phage-related protein
VEVIEATIQCKHVFYRLIVEVIEATLQCVHVFYRLTVEVIETTIQCVLKHMYTLYCSLNHFHG